MRLSCFATAICAVALLTSCDQLFDKGTKRTIESADKKAEAGNYRAAISLYESGLDGTAKTAEVHYKLAVIYDEKMKSPADALHHFKRYLELAPSGTFAREAKAYKQEGELKMMNAINKGSFATQQDAVRLKNENLALRNQLTALRAQKAATPPPATAMRDSNAQRPVPPGSRTHVVKAGETLGSIAAKYYRNKARWKDIQDANFYSLEGTAKIKPGQTLIIP
jgi:tetratricopeptide (TPR) repeat protein